MEKQPYNIHKTISTVLIIVASILLVILFKTDYNFKSMVVVEKINNSLAEGCSNLSIEESAYCMKNNLKPFYYYNLSNAGREISLAELKEQGGVCSHYNNLYVNAAKELGYWVEEVIIKIGDKRRHIFSVISNEKGYCNLDMLSVDCYEFRGDRGENGTTT